MVLGASGDHPGEAARPFGRSGVIFESPASSNVEPSVGTLEINHILTLLRRLFEGI